jgi:hypothetical protein
MGKASRRRKDGAPGTADTQDKRAARRAQVPFARRPFEGLANETEWVALREIVPAATAVVSVAGEGIPENAGQVTIATVLPMAWPGLHRGDGTVFIATQTSGASGDASRDLVAQLQATAALEPGTPLVNAPVATVDTPRLQDVVTGPIEVTVHEGFDFWVEGQELDGEAKESLERANASAIPTSRMAALPSAYWCRIGERTHIRLVLPEDEDAATDALARLWAAGTAGVGDGTRLLGAFRACGLLVPVWDLDPALGADDYEDALAAWGRRYAEALTADTPATAEERRARSGFLSRQVTLR